MLEQITETEGSIPSTKKKQQIFMNHQQQFMNTYAKPFLLAYGIKLVSEVREDGVHVFTSYASKDFAPLKKENEYATRLVQEVLDKNRHIPYMKSIHLN